MTVTQEIETRDNRASSSRSPPAVSGRTTRSSPDRAVRSDAARGWAVGGEEVTNPIHRPAQHSPSAVIHLSPARTALLWQASSFDQGSNCHRRRASRAGRRTYTGPAPRSCPPEGERHGRRVRASRPPSSPRVGAPGSSTRLQSSSRASLDSFTHGPGELGIIKDLTASWCAVRHASGSAAPGPRLGVRRIVSLPGREFAAPLTGEGEGPRRAMSDIRNRRLHRPNGAHAGRGPHQRRGRRSANRNDRPEPATLKVRRSAGSTSSDITDAMEEIGAAFAHSPASQARGDEGQCKEAARHGLPMALAR